MPSLVTSLLSMICFVKSGKARIGAELSIQLPDCILTMICPQELPSLFG